MEMGLKAKKVTETTFLVNYPSMAKINEAVIYDWVPLKGGTIMVNAKICNDDSLATGSMYVVWVTFKESSWSG